jgi:hypothetical protein
MNKFITGATSRNNSGIFIKKNKNNVVQKVKQNEQPIPYFIKNGNLEFIENLTFSNI